MKIKRAYYIFKCRTHVLTSHLIERILHILSKWGLIVEHKEDHTNLFDRGNPQTAPDIKTERFVFEVSYVIRAVEFKSEYWFETKRKHKRIYTVYENHHEETRLSFRAELKSFYAHFSHKHKMWVHRYNPRIAIGKFHCHTCDFSQCRFASEICLPPEISHRIDEEVIFESCRVLKNNLMNKVPDINKMLTGAENDGELTTPYGLTLADNIVCKNCGYPVFATKTGNYTYLCIHHGVINRGMYDKVGHEIYKKILENCLSELELFCDCPQD